MQAQAYKPGQISADQQEALADARKSAILAGMPELCHMGVGQWAGTPAKLSHGNADKLPSLELATGFSAGIAKLA